ncbi:peptidylprolyl isomerase [Flavitalea sp.]|nr:peptidylprolyl isomerase [Flavitalea sp.]
MKFNHSRRKLFSRFTFTVQYDFFNSFFFATLICFLLVGCSPRLSKPVSKRDLGKDIEMITDRGTMILRLSDSTPLHRDNFIRLVKSGFYNGITFHRVIQGFMIQAGDPRTKKTKDSAFRSSTRIPAEIRPELYHKKGVLAAAREGDASNPTRASSYSQFYLVQGRVFTDFSLDSTETYRLKGRKLPVAHREVYKTLGGSPHLDQNYTVFGEVISGIGVIDLIAGSKTSGKEGGDRPLQDIRIQKMRLVSRK